MSDKARQAASLHQQAHHCYDLRSAVKVRAQASQVNAKHVCVDMHQNPVPKPCTNIVARERIHRNIAGMCAA
jgi:hypothetical protein